MVMNNLRNKFFITLMLVASVFVSCKNQWNSHDAITDPALTVNLLQQINANPNLSLFSKYLTQTGYDKVIASSKSFTIWAPTNAAFQSVDPNILGNAAALSKLIANHISFQLYGTGVPNPSIRVTTLNGKAATFTKTTFEEANIIKADQYVTNGIIQIIDKVIIPKQNIWEYVTDSTRADYTTQGLLQATYIKSQTYYYQDTTKATVDHINPLTGKPVLVPGTGIDTLNHYFDGSANLKDETQQYTYFVMLDGAYTTETSKVLKFFNTTSPDSTNKLAALNVCKDLVAPGYYTLANLPDTLTSVNGIKLPVNKNSIVKTYNASNGIVYYVSSVGFRLQDKITNIIVQGESVLSYARTDKGGAIDFRLRVDPNNVPYEDLYIGTSSSATITAGFFAAYSIQKVYSAQYKVYWRAINENSSTFSQQLIINQNPNLGSYTAAIPLTTVFIRNYNEVYVGTITYNRYGQMSLYLSDGTGATPLTLDYLKFVPVLQ